MKNRIMNYDSWPIKNLMLQESIIYSAFHLITQVETNIVLSFLTFNK